MISSKSGLHISSSIMLSICFNHYNWGKLYFILFPLKVASIFFDLVCSVYVVTNTTEVHYSFMITSKSGFHIPGLLCSVYVIAITIGVSYIFY